MARASSGVKLLKILAPNHLHTNDPFALEISTRGFRLAASPARLHKLVRAANAPARTQMAAYQSSLVVARARAGALNAHAHEQNHFFASAKKRSLVDFTRAAQAALKMGAVLICQRR